MGHMKRAPCGGAPRWGSACQVCGVCRAGFIGIIGYGIGIPAFFAFLLVRNKDVLHYPQARNTPEPSLLCSHKCCQAC